MKRLDLNRPRFGFSGDALRAGCPRSERNLKGPLFQSIETMPDTPITDNEAPRILIVRLSAIGDCLHTIPVLVALRNRFPKATIGWAIERGSHRLLQGHPMVNQFHEYPRHAFKRKEGTFLNRIQKLSAFRKELRNAQYDVSIDLQGLTKSGLVSWWSGAKTRIGFKGDDSREISGVFANCRQAIPDQARHVVDRNLCLLKPLFEKNTPNVEWRMPDYSSERARIRPFLDKVCENGRPAFMLINPGATWVTKRWSPERFGLAARKLVTSLGVQVVATWAGEEERTAAERIVTLANEGQARPAAFLAPDTNLRELAALTSKACLFLGNDTGPLHLAVALGVPCVAVFGASDPIRNGPYGAQNKVVTIDLECRPCWKTTCHREDLACLTLLDEDSVVAACKDILNDLKRGDR